MIFKKNGCFMVGNGNARKHFFLSSLKWREHVLNKWTQSMAEHD